MANALVSWKGGRFTAAFRDSQAEVDRLVPGFTLTQGGFNGTKVSASAGTHAGDSADYSVRGKTKAQVSAFITAQRLVGNAAWFRTTRIGKWGTRAHGFTSYHIHVVPNGWASPSKDAREQALGEPGRDRTGYRNARDGLNGNGPDSGPGHTGLFRTRTWWDYKSSASPVVSKPVVQKTDPNAPAITRVYAPLPWPTVAVDGNLGSTTLSRLQMTLNIAVTGKLDHYTIRALKVWLGNKDDGVGVLYKTNIEQLQSRVLVDKDGKWGAETTKGLQRYLNANKKKAPPTPTDSIPRVYAKKPWPVLTVDGVMGSNTITRLQMTLNVALTGKLDHYTIRALRVWLGNKDDGKGIMTPTNYLQLQDRVGAVKDGQWGIETTKSLQRYLNKNK